MPPRSPFIVGPPVRRDDFVDRDDTLRMLRQLVTDRRGNILLSGDRRAGKTSVCLQLDATLTGDQPKVAYISMEANYERSPGQLAQAVLVKLLSTLAAVCFEKTYAQLLLDLRDAPAGLRDDYAALLRLFDLARQPADAGLLHQPDYLALLDDFVSYARQLGITNPFLVIVDEANKLTIEANEVVIRENLSLLSKADLQFCFVTTPQVTALVDSRELFHEVVEVGPFEDVGSLYALINTYMDTPRNQPAPTFEEPAIETIWNLSRGMPYEMQLLCDESLIRAYRDGSPTVTVAHVVQATAARGFRA
jgi:AAA ATPase domain